MLKKCSFLFVLILSTSAFAQAEGEPSLVIHDGKKSISFSQSDLLQHPFLESVVIEKDPAYGNRKTQYKAVKVTRLFDGLKIASDAVIQFRALDGFSAPISKERLLNSSTQASRAYVAVEDPKHKWPAIASGKSSAGPFYLVWPQPELSYIAREEWPFMLAAFEIKGTFQSLYPFIFPKKGTQEKSPVMRGFNVFTKNCFACHTLNKNGASQMGPDLNVPMNVTEYINDNAIKKIIRSPQSVRHWPNSRMFGFSAEHVSDREIDDLLAYLKHMSKNKRKF